MFLSTSTDTIMNSVSLHKARAVVEKKSLKNISTECTTVYKCYQLNGVLVDIYVAFPDLIFYKHVTTLYLFRETYCEIYALFVCLRYSVKRCDATLGHDSDE